MTCQEAYDKIIEAYFKDEIKPLNPHFCFCGTLSPDERWWYNTDDRSAYPYAIYEYAKMEKALFSFIPEIRWQRAGTLRYDADEIPSACPSKGIRDYENKLFLGMSAALDVLKEIHRERGEDVDNISKPFTKRQLVN